jgi:arabinose-5-phosphate isomerase
MGKAGIIAQKISATLASTGTPSINLNPAEAYHGDLGRITKDDVVIALSNSGETEEIVKLIPRVKKIGARVIAITSKDSSTLANLSDITLTIGEIEEPCPLKLAPSASTTAMLALGDALSLCVLKERGFNEEQFAFLHPAGEIGKRFIKVRELMRTGERNPLIKEGATVKEALFKITSCRAGAVNVIDDQGRLSGIFTDGDLRRWISRDPGILQARIKDVMTKDPIVITPDEYAWRAAEIISEKKIDEVPVVDKNRIPIGMLDIQDLLELGLI